MKKIQSILYVEDDIAVQNEVKNILKHLCEKLYLADNGLQGLDLYKQHMPQLILSDINMPTMDGIELCKQVKQIKKDQHILLLTSFRDTQYLRAAIELQVSGYILKPLDMELLVEKIDSIAQEFAVKNDLFLKEQILIQQSKLASMGEMIANISHQLKQPLSIISLSSSHMEIKALTGQIDPDEIIEESQAILEQIEFMSNTITSFRNFLNPCSNEHYYNVKEFLNKCVELVDSSFKTHQISTIVEISQDINSFGNPNYLIQAIINILNNARDALQETKELEKKLVFVSLLPQEEDHIVIEIKDNAGGIPNNTLDKVFDPYFTTKGELKGTGIGLYMTNEIITKKLHGSIEVLNETYDYEDHSYTGAKFLMKLPMIQIKDKEVSTYD